MYTHKKLKQKSLTLFAYSSMVFFIHYETEIKCMVVLKAKDLSWTTKGMCVQ